MQCTGSRFKKGGDSRSVPSASPGSPGPSVALAPGCDWTPRGERERENERARDRERLGLIRSMPDVLYRVQPTILYVGAKCTTNNNIPFLIL